MGYWLMRLLVLLILCSGCGGSPEKAAGPELVSVGGEALESLPPILRLRLSGMPKVEANALWLIRGELTSTDQKKLRFGEISDSLAARRQPLVLWSEKAAFVLASTTVLEPGEHYSLAAISYGLIAELRIAEADYQVLERMGTAVQGPHDELVYCATGTSTACLPAHGERGLRQGVAEERCLRVQASIEIDGFLVPPVAAGSCLLDPRLVPIVSAPKSGSLSPEPWPVADCSGENNLFLESACLEVVGATAKLQLALGVHAASLSLRGKVVHRLLAEHDRESTYVWGPLEPNASYQLTLYSALSGAPQEGKTTEIEFVAPGAAPYWVLTEALLDPSGAEPQGEWIEVLNAGSGEGDLGGYELVDESGKITLPPASLSPGERALIVREDFDFSSDIVPVATALPVRVPRLGGNGLKNSGERIRLEDSTGQVVSELAALKVPEGISVCRVNPFGELGSQSVREHALPGASPGAANDCEPLAESD